jgi:pyridoxine 4-dehydrogenase
MSRTLGKNGPAVSSLGLGAMGMSDLYGAADRAESVATIQAALDAGISGQDSRERRDQRQVRRAA